MQASDSSAQTRLRLTELAVITSSYWRERRVFLTGHTGFKGAWLSLMLDRLNARVTGFGLGPATHPALYDLVDAGRALCDVRGDVADAAMLDGALRAADPDLVIHLATRAPRAAVDPDRPASAGEAGDLTLIEAALDAPSVQTVILVAPERQKRTALWRAHAHGGPARVLAAYCPDPIGGGDFALAHDNPAAALHVLDALYGVLLLAETAERRGRIATDWSFAADDERAPKRNQAIGWSPLLDGMEAAAWTAEWRRAFFERDDMHAVTLAQIDAYLGQRVKLTSPFAAITADDAPRLRAAGA